MRNIKQLINDLIPPDNYQYRKDFTNHHLVSSLTEIEKTEVERNLIALLNETDDDLIGETLAIMKSTNSVPTLKKRLVLAKDPTSKILWASFIDNIKGGDNEMKEIALIEFDSITEKYALITIFYPLSKFNDSRINDKIRNFVNHKDYLIAHNARASLGIDTAEILKKEQHKNRIGAKKWWEIWK